MYPSTTAELKIVETISVLVEKYLPDSLHSLNESICAKWMPFVLDDLDALYDMKIDRSKVLTMSIINIAKEIQWHIADQVHARLIDVIDNVAAIDRSRIHPLTRIVDDLCLDSNSLINIGVNLEDEFGIAIQDDRLHSFQTIAAMENYIREQLDAKQ